MKQRIAIAALAALLPPLLFGCYYNKHAVIERSIYRSAQPFEEDLQAWVRRDGIKTILRVRPGKPGSYWYEQSRRGGELGGAKIVQINMSAHRFPEKEQLLQVIEALKTAPRPILIHCQAGADRTGLVSAIAVLDSGGTVEQADEQLDFVPYTHLNAFDTARMDETIRMYAPWEGTLTIRQWITDVYEKPEFESLPDDFVARENARVEHYRETGKLLPSA